MNRVLINLEALAHNLGRIRQLMAAHGASYTIVTKALCGHRGTLRALWALGERSFADSRLNNLRALSREAPGSERWYLRPPHLSGIGELLELAQVSLNSELETLRALSREARRRELVHRVVIMVELGDLREGVLPGNLQQFFRTVHTLPNLKIVGLGGQLGCLSGAVPDREKMARLLRLRDGLRAGFRRSLSTVSAGSSVFLPLLAGGEIPRAVNHFRIGEALLLGTDLLAGGTLAGFRDDVIRLEGEVVELKEKRLAPAEAGGAATPFAALTETGAGEATHGYRALVALGQLDTEISGLTPASTAYQIAGASSDITAVNLGQTPGALRVGERLQFKPNYAALVRAMNNPYLKKELQPSLEQLLVRRSALPLASAAQEVA